MKKPLLFLLALLSMTGCSHVMSEEARRLADPAIDFAELRRNPDLLVGRHVMLGGIIAGAANGAEGGRIEVVEFPLGREGLPRDAYESGGRFLATSPLFIDDVVYRRGRLVTMVGEVKGKRTLPLDAVTYTYPVISIRELYLWKEYEGDKLFAYPPPLPTNNPYYPGHWPDFYWYRPIGPPLR